MIINNLPLISVVIPVYNHSKYVVDCIDSIINQTYQNIELLVIDDGSKDDSFEVVSKMKSVCEKRFVNFSFKKHENKGLCETLNDLIKSAKGEYIYIIASDDLSKPTAIETLYNFLSKNKDYALAVGNNEFIDNNNTRVFWDKKSNNIYNEEKSVYKTFVDFLQSKRKDISFCSDDFGTYKSLLRGNYIPNGYLIVKSIYDKTGYYTKEAPLEDQYMMMQISKYAKLKYIDEILFSYRWHSENTASNSARMLAMANKTMHYEAKNIENCDDENLKKMFIDAMYKKKYIIKIPYIFELYKVKYINQKSLYIDFFGKSFLLRKKEK